MVPALPAHPRLSCDSRFPHLQPEQQLEQGNHFLLLFECDPQEAREAALEAGADDRAADLVFAECARRRVQKAKAVTADRDVTWAPYYDPSKPPRRRFGVSPLLVGALGVVAKLRLVCGAKVKTHRLPRPNVALPVSDGERERRRGGKTAARRRVVRVAHDGVPAARQWTRSERPARERGS